MRRRRTVVLIAAGVIVFVAVSALLARAFSATGAESAAVTDLVRAQARGDANGVLDRIHGCRASSACQVRVAQDVAALRHSGAVSILQVTPSASFSLSATLGTARVAWTVAASLPIVQCVRVRRTGNVLSGVHIELLKLSAKIKSDADCPAQF
ncbi:MAG: hypothetical protein ACR2OB_03565 [Solirubrobacteraceae bacterium]